MHNRDRGGANLAFIDILLNFSMGLFMLFILVMTIMSINKINQEGVKTNAQYIVSLYWEDGIDCDVDLWVEDASGNIAWFRHRDGPVGHLERDDRGLMGDTIIQEGRILAIKSNEERWTMRGIVAGEYVINVHLYTCRVQKDKGRMGPYAEGDPVDLNVMVRLERINPALKVIKEEEVKFDYVWQEKTAFRFTLNAIGDVVKLDTTPKALIDGKALEEMERASQGLSGVQVPSELPTIPPGTGP